MLNICRAMMTLPMHIPNTAKHWTLIEVVAESNNGHRQINGLEKETGYTECLTLIWAQQTSKEMPDVQESVLEPLMSSLLCASMCLSCISMQKIKIRGCNCGTLWSLFLVTFCNRNVTHTHCSHPHRKTVDREVLAADERKYSRECYWCVSVWFCRYCKILHSIVLPVNQIISYLTLPGFGYPP